jgi:hypothetical protein
VETNIFSLIGITVFSWPVSLYISEEISTLLWNIFLNQTFNHDNPLSIKSISSLTFIFVCTNFQCFYEFYSNFHPSIYFCKFYYYHVNLFYKTDSKFYKYKYKVMKVILLYPFYIIFNFTEEQCMSPDRFVSYVFCRLHSFV